MLSKNVDLHSKKGFQRNHNIRFRYLFKGLTTNRAVIRYNIAISHVSTDIN